MVTTILLSSIPFLGGAILGAFAWASNINTKVATLEVLTNQKFEDLKELIESKFDNVSNSFDSQNKRLDRIERSLNGALNH